MVSPFVKKQVWEDFVEAERFYRYYHGLYEKHQRIRFWMRVTMLIAVLTATLPLPLPTLGQSIVSAAAAIVASVALLIDFAIDPAKKSSVCFSISRECGLLVERYRKLWIGIKDETIGDDEAVGEFRELADRIGLVTSRSSDADIMEDKKLSDRSDDDANMIMKNRYVQQEAI